MMRYGSVVVADVVIVYKIRSVTLKKDSAAEKVRLGRRSGGCCVCV